ncbi:hypothetical protein NM688_g6767 [Phlebia brevispora]|uniref:Uncharacterized protein n=1 Tax=Phlebia brevispora TaxID=194682 RepID=A0ACC1SCN3_9APHY|nr:hypothetical protein NM688_g6767 [Phlebia brevispora]
MTEKRFAAYFDVDILGAQGFSMSSSNTPTTRSSCSTPIPAPPPPPRKRQPQRPQASRQAVSCDGYMSSKGESHSRTPSGDLYRNKAFAKALHRPSTPLTATFPKTASVSSHASSPLSRSSSEVERDTPPTTPEPSEEHAGSNAKQRAGGRQAATPIIDLCLYTAMSLWNDYHTTDLLERLTGGSPTFHQYEQPPRRVLDLGCGEGTWVKHAAAKWNSPDTHIDGLDIRPLWESGHRHVETSILSCTVSWKVANFLDQLPYEDNTFDLVRAANLALCIPYHCWLPFLREVKRILRVGGRLELIDDEFFFPPIQHASMLHSSSEIPTLRGLTPSQSESERISRFREVEESKRITEYVENSFGLMLSTKYDVCRPHTECTQDLLKVFEVLMVLDDHPKGSEPLGKSVLAPPRVPGRNEATTQLEAPPACNRPADESPAEPDDPAYADLSVRFRDDIRVEYHPCTNRPEELYRFENYSRTHGRPEIDSKLFDSDPWEPFSSRDDFEFAELCLEAGLNKRHVTTLLELFTRAKEGHSKLSFKQYSDVEFAWKTASDRQPPFERTYRPYTFKGVRRTYEFFRRDLWKVALSYIRDPILAPHWTWEPIRLSKWDERKHDWVRFIDEPITADKLWDVLPTLPKRGIPFAIYLYADETRLSSFGSQQGYPIIMRFPQLDSKLSNGSAYGGGMIVGFLPILKGKAADKNSDAWKDLTKVVWHECFYELLQVLVPLAAAGFHVKKCGDGLPRWLFPILLILAADYKEQCIMALTRGVKSLFPCPVCLIPKDRLKYVSDPVVLRTSQEGEDILAKSLTKTKREAELKAKGLYGIKNAFWSLPNFNLHEALSFDRLHSYHSGLFGKHLFVEFKYILEGMGPQAQSQIDASFNSVPRWRNLNHFSDVADMSFTDGSKYEDISKTIVQASAHVLTASKLPEGYCLLKLIRKYIELDMYLSFEVHTEDTLTAYERALDEYEALLLKYESSYNSDNSQHANNEDDADDEDESSSDDNSDHSDSNGQKDKQQATLHKRKERKRKNWNFPKGHMHRHAIRDIRAKGATKHYNTKPNEQMHGPLKRIYLRRTNFKNPEEQLSKITHSFLCAASLRAQTDAWDEEKKSKTWEQLTEFRYAKIDYESLVTWKTAQDIVRCNPSFFSQPRYDCIIVHASGNVHDDTAKFVFAQLIFIFIISVQGTEYPLALVQLMQSSGTPRLMDQELCLYRVRAQPRAKAAFIPVRSIKRGALMFQVPNTADNFYVVDAVDSDMFLCTKQIFGR